MDENNSMNGQDVVSTQNVVTIPTKDNPEDSSTKDSTQPTPSSKESKKEESKKVEGKSVPYPRFSEVTKKNGILETELKHKDQLLAETQKRLADLEAQIGQITKGKDLTDKQTQQITEEIPDEIIELFGEENAPKGKKALESFLRKVLDSELTERQKKQIEEAAKAEAEARQSESWVKQETDRLVQADPELDVNKFHLFIQQTAEAKGYGFFKDGKLDFDTYYEMYQLKNPKVTKTNEGLDKIAGKTITKTEVEKVYTPKDFRNF